MTATALEISLLSDIENFLAVRDTGGNAKVSRQIDIDEAGKETHHLTLYYEIDPLFEKPKRPRDSDPPSGSY